MCVCVLVVLFTFCIFSIYYRLALHIWHLRAYLISIFDVSPRDAGLAVHLCIRVSGQISVCNKNSKYGQMR